MRKKILVTGGAGYIGSHTVVELFLSGYDPIIIDNLSNSSEYNLNGINKILNTNIPFYNINCTDVVEMERFFNFNEDIYACIHFAAFKSVDESIKHPEKYYKNNIGSTEVLISCLEKQKIKNLIFSSSCTVYGMPDVLPVTEFAPFKKAESPYGETKQRCENLIKKSKCNSISLRYFNPIGSHESGLIGDCSSDNATNLVPIISEVAHRLRKKLIVNGDNYNTIDGTCVRDYIHVVDLALAHVSSLKYFSKNTGNFFFNVGTGSGYSVLQIINAFEKVNGIKINYSIGPRRKGDVEKIYADCNLIKSELGWEAKRSLNEAVVSAFKWKIKK